MPQSLVNNCSQKKGGTVYFLDISSLPLESQVTLVGSQAAVYRMLRAERCKDSQQPPPSQFSHCPWITLIDESKTNNDGTACTGSGTFDLY